MAILLKRLYLTDESNARRDTKYAIRCIRKKIDRSIDRFLSLSLFFLFFHRSTTKGNNHRIIERALHWEGQSLEPRVGRLVCKRNRVRRKGWVMLSSREKEKDARCTVGIGATVRG